MLHPFFDGGSGMDIFIEKDDLWSDLLMPMSEDGSSFINNSCGKWGDTWEILVLTVGEK